jgi:hypothetical protein
MEALQHMLKKVLSAQLWGNVTITVLGLLYDKRWLSKADIYQSFFYAYAYNDVGQEEQRSRFHCGIGTRLARPVFMLSLSLFPRH